MTLDDYFTLAVMLAIAIVGAAIIIHAIDQSEDWDD